MLEIIWILLKCQGICRLVSSSLRIIDILENMLGSALVKEKQVHLPSDMYEYQPKSPIGFCELLRDALIEFKPLKAVRSTVDGLSKSQTRWKARLFFLLISYRWTSGMDTEIFQNRPDTLAYAELAWCAFCDSSYKTN